MKYNRNKYEKRIRVVETQRDRERGRLLELKERIRPVNAILDHIKPRSKKGRKNEKSKTVCQKQ